MKTDDQKQFILQTQVGNQRGDQGFQEIVIDEKNVIDDGQRDDDEADEAQLVVVNHRRMILPPFSVL